MKLSHLAVAFAAMTLTAAPALSENNATNPAKSGTSSEAQPTRVPSRKAKRLIAHPAILLRTVRLTQLQKAQSALTPRKRRRARLPHSDKHSETERQLIVAVQV